MPVVFDNMIIHYFSCSTVQSTIWNTRWFWNDKMSLCIEIIHCGRWDICIGIERESVHCTGPCTAELKNLLEDWFLVFCVTFLIFTHDSFFFSKCLTSGLNRCTHISNVFSICAHTYFFLIFGFLIFNTAFAFFYYSCMS